MHAATLGTPPKYNFESNIVLSIPFWGVAIQSLETWPRVDVSRKEVVQRRGFADSLWGNCKCRRGLRALARGSRSVAHLHRYVCGSWFVVLFLFGDLGATSGAPVGNFGTIAWQPYLRAGKSKIAFARLLERLRGSLTPPARSPGTCVWEVPTTMG